MKNSTRFKICYTISAGYVVISLLFLDWAFNMVPYSKDTPIAKIIVETTYTSILLLIGILFLFSTFFLSRKKTLGIKLGTITFWSGAPLLVTLSLLATYLYMHRGLKLEMIFYTVFMNILFYIPAIFVFANIKALSKGST